MVAVAVVLDRVVGGGGSGPTVVLGASKHTVRRGVSGNRDQVIDGGARNVGGLSPARFPSGLPTDSVSDRDIFGLTATARRALLQDLEALDAAGNPGGETREDERRALVESVEQFKARHTVSAVVSSGAFATVLVDEAWMTVGQSLDGCRLVRIRGPVVVFECLGEEVELSVDADELSVSGESEVEGGNLKTHRAGVDTVLD